YSDKSLLSISFIVMTLASVGFALYPSYNVFAFTLFSLGSCMAVLQVVINPMLRSAGGEEHFAFNSVLAQLVFGSASFASPFLYKYVVDTNSSEGGIATTLRSLVPENLPWVGLYIVFSIISMVLVLIVLFTKYPEYDKKEDEIAGSSQSYVELLKNKYTVLFFLGIFCYVGAEQGVGNWISQFLYEYHGFDAQTVGADTVAYFWAMLTVGCLLGLLLLKIMDSRRLLIGATLISMICLVTALTGSGSIALFAFPAIGFSISVMWSIIFSLALNSVKENHGSLSGILCTGIAGGAVIPFLVGALGETTGLKTGMFFLLIPLTFILSIGFWANPLVTNKTIRLKGGDDS
ncbi:MAG: MFS transporter, partial [Pricia sp.]